MLVCIKSLSFTMKQQQKRGGKVRKSKNKREKLSLFAKVPFKTAPSPLVNFVNGLSTPFSIMAAVSTAPSSRTCEATSKSFCSEPPPRTVKSPVFGSNSTTPRNFDATFLTPPETAETASAGVLPEVINQ